MYTPRVWLTCHAVGKGTLRDVRLLPEDEVEGNTGDGKDDSSCGQEGICHYQRQMNSHYLLNGNTIVGNSSCTDNSVTYMSHAAHHTEFVG